MMPWDNVSCETSAFSSHEWPVTEEMKYALSGQYHSKDGSKRCLFRKQWKSTKFENPKAIVFHCHGVAEHTNAYKFHASIVEPLVMLGCLVIGHDHVGHGRSSGTRLYVKDYKIYVTDVLEYIHDIQKIYPDLPVFICGHSLGGTIATLVSLEDPNVFDKGGGLILNSAIIEFSVGVKSSMTGYFVKILSLVYPKFPVNSFPIRKIPHNEQSSKHYGDDAHCHAGHVKARWVTEVRKALKQLRKNMEQVCCPILILHGEMDCIADVKGATELFARCSSTDKQIVVLKKAHHLLHAEDNEVVDIFKKTLIKWIEERLVYQSS